VRAAGAGGIWIGIAPENGKVVQFYERLGFRLVREGGGGITMVRDL
jgi:ribosomal protein S18 acetylase RimI-like enzyme